MSAWCTLQAAVQRLNLGRGSGTRGTAKEQTAVEEHRCSAPVVDSSQVFYSSKDCVQAFLGASAGQSRTASDIPVRDEVRRKLLALPAHWVARILGFNFVLDSARSA